MEHSLPTEPIGEPTSGEHAECLGHLCESLPIRNDLGANSGSAVDGGVGHLIDERLHGDDVSGDLLLELDGDVSSRPSPSTVRYDKVALTPSFIAAQLRIMQKIMAFQNTLAVDQRPRPAAC